ncbi:MAG: hypothetical protein J6R29_01955, partial [Clostridia bacterium]|nr:hypothetical protein [Clostridia bacterium]
MKNNTNKYLNYLSGLVKGSNIFACLFASALTMLGIYFFDGFNLVSALLGESVFEIVLVAIIGSLGLLTLVASSIKHLKDKKIAFVDNLLVLFLFLIIDLIVYFLIARSKSFLLIKILLPIFLIGVSVAIFFIRIKFFEGSKENVKTEKISFYTYCINLIKRYWIFTIVLIISLLAFLIYLYNAEILVKILSREKILPLLNMAIAFAVGIYLFVLSIRAVEKEQNLVDCATVSLIVAGLALLVIGCIMKGQLQLVTFIMAISILVITSIAMFILVKNTKVYDEESFKHKKGNALLYFKSLFKNGNLALYIAFALFATSIVTIFEETNFFLNFYVHQLNGSNMVLVLEIFALVLGVVFVLLLSDLVEHKIHFVDQVLFIMAITFALMIVIVNLVLGHSFMYEGLLLTICLVLTVVYIGIRIIFVKEFDPELVASVKELEVNTEEPIIDKAKAKPTQYSCKVEEPVVEFEKSDANEDVVEAKEDVNGIEAIATPAVCEEQAVTKEEESIKLKRVNVKKSFEIYVKTGDEQLKENYSQIKNAFLSYGLHARLTKSRENFSKKGVTLSKIKEGKEIRLQAKLLVRGKFLKLYINVNPSSVDLKYFRALDVSSKMPDQPLYVKIRSKLSLKRALELIDILAVQENFNSKKKFTEVDYASLLSSEGLTY